MIPLNTIRVRLGGKAQQRTGERGETWTWQEPSTVGRESPVLFPCATISSNATTSLFFLLPFNLARNACLSVPATRLSGLPGGQSSASLDIPRLRH